MSSTDHAPAHALPDTTHLASVRVGVGDLERSLAWYDRWFGLVAHALDEHGVLGLAPVGGRVILELVERPGVQPFGGRHTGLYHFALRVPERVDLARWLAYAAQQQLPLVGAADHFVSEAIYLTDPDGHGIEIYWDRPRSTWEGQVRLMTTASLDINDLFSELETLAISSGSARVPPETVMGHVHLQVADIDSTVAFLRDVVGFEVMARLGRQAAFLATGGYHHDIGANTWSSRGCPAGAGHDGAPGAGHLRGSRPGGPRRSARARRRRRARLRGRPPRDRPHRPICKSPDLLYGIGIVLIRNRIRQRSVKFPQQRRRRRSDGPFPQLCWVDLRLCPAHMGALHLAREPSNGRTRMSFWHFLWEMLVVFAFVVWIIIFFQVVFDLFRSHDVSGLGKAGWIILLIILPFLGVLIYLIVRGHGMADRAVKTQLADADRLRAASGLAPADQIAQAKQLLDQGAISPEEYQAIKDKVIS